MVNVGFLVNTGYASCGDYLDDHSQLTDPRSQDFQDALIVTPVQGELPPRSHLEDIGSTQKKPISNSPCNGPGCRGHQAPTSPPTPTNTFEDVDRWFLTLAQFSLQNESLSSGLPEDALAPLEAPRGRIDHPPKF